MEQAMAVFLGQFETNGTAKRADIRTDRQRIIALLLGRLTSIINDDG